MRRRLALSFVFATPLFFSHVAPASFTPAISDIIELDRASPSPDALARSLPDSGPSRDKPATSDSAKDPTKLTPLARAKLALADSDAEAPTEHEICTTLLAVAQQNDLPLGFFTNLIWQESRFDHDSISRAGAMGIAQFMPDVADALGLNAFDARDALPASGRLLRTLRVKFGNLGLVAAAYNAGPKRVSDWLAGRSTLPSETRAYVNVITGRPPEQWRGKERAAVYRVPKQVPCHRAPAFASVEQSERAIQLAKLDEELKAAEAARIEQKKREARFTAKSKPAARTASVSSRPSLTRMANLRR